MRFVSFSLLIFPFFLLAEEKVDFNTQIKSILSNKCIACHGPDEENREAGLRLDTF
ncbi:MAG: c-type cytochrome domain-containing protein, partial [Burkholderiaceae bacterium]